ncbi:MAG: flagellar biosynthesis protein FlhF [Rhodocyclaceae bacterium]|nr:flagellar biosynthesis protein FlhF [Rhodocyclaceae bacterium]
MMARRFFGSTAREALRRVKDELGADAIVLANRSVDGGVEILAAPPDALIAPPPPRPAAPPPAPPQAAISTGAALPDEDEEPDFHVTLSQSLERRSAPAAAPAQNWKPFRPPRVDAPAPAGRTPEKAAPAAERQPARSAKKPAADENSGANLAAKPAPDALEPAPARAPAAAPARATSRVEETEPAAGTRMMEELQSIRDLIERQLSGFAWGELARTSPVKTLLSGEMLEAGFSADLTRNVIDALAGSDNAAAARNEVRAQLNRGLQTLGSDEDIIDRGGVYALVGPTGVGKTTTTAKLAARCVVRHGADRVALLTTDGYRIGAHEQLRIYGRILGVPVHVVRDGQDLRRTLADCSDRHMVLIDTVGMSQRDRMVAEQAAMLIGSGDVRRLLLLNATSRGDTLDEVVRAYMGPDLAGAIVTKLDEAASLAPVLDVLIRHQLELFYVANGQRVPEDLHLPSRPYLLHRALKLTGEASPHRLDAAGAGLLMASAGTARTNGGRRG